MNAASVGSVRLTDEDIQEFIKLWEREFAERLTPDEARYHVSRVLELFTLLAQPLPGEMREHPGPEPSTFPP